VVPQPTGDVGEPCGIICSLFRKSVVFTVIRDLNDAYAKVPGVQTRPADLTPETNVIRTTFRGEVEVTTTTFKSDVAGEPTVETTRTAFLYLSMELPPVPLFKDDEGGNVIPQVPLFTVLKKFDGVTHTVRARVRSCGTVA
jgi:hypothetical protein